MEPPTPHRKRPTSSVSNEGAQADTAAPTLSTAMPSSIAVLMPKRSAIQPAGMWAMP